MHFYRKEKPMSTNKMPKRYCMLRVPVALHQRLTHLAKEILLAKESARGYDDVPLAEQGERGVFVPLHAVIARALNEFEGHRARSRTNCRKTK